MEKILILIHTIFLVWWKSKCVFFLKIGETKSDDECELRAIGIDSPLQMTFIHRLLASGFRFWSASIFCLPSAHGSTLRTNKEIEFFQSLSIKPKNRRQKLFRATGLQYGLHSWTTHLPRATLWSVPIFLFVFKGKKG